MIPDSIVTTDGVRLRYRIDGYRIDDFRIDGYRIEGAANRPTVILSNSLGTDLSMWAPQVAALGAGWRVVRYDMRGHGGSSVPRRGFGLDRLGRDVLDLMDALRIERAAFCGLSLGGMVGLWLGARAPLRIDRLVIANSAARIGPPAGWNARIEAVARAGMAAIADPVLARWFTPAFRDGGDAAVDASRAMLLGTDPAGYRGCCAAIRDADLRPLLPLIGVPTLVIGGSRDAATPPADAEALAGAIAGASLAMLDAAHLSNLEQPEGFNRVLLAHLDPYPRAGPGPGAPRQLHAPGG